MKKVSLFLFTVLVIVVSCNKNEVFLRDLERFVTDVELNFRDYSEEEWLAKDKEFTELSETRFKKLRERLSDEEISRANELIGKYKALKLKKGINDIKTGIKDLFQQGKGVVKELLPDSDKVRDAIERNKSEVKELFPDSLK